MSDALRTMGEFGAQLGGRQAKAASRIARRDSLPLVEVNGSWLIRQSTIEAWIDAHTVDPEPFGLKALVHQAVERARARKAS